MKGICVGCGYKASSTDDLAAHYRKEHCVTKDIAAMVAAQDGRCYWCDRDMRVSGPHKHPLYASREHVIAVANGGTNDSENMRAAHNICNNIRGALPEESFREIIDNLNGVINGALKKPPKVFMMLNEHQYNWLRTLTQEVAKQCAKGTDDYCHAMAIQGQVMNCLTKLDRLIDALKDPEKS